MKLKTKLITKLYDTSFYHIIVNQLQFTGYSGVAKAVGPGNTRRYTLPPANEVSVNSGNRNQVNNMFTHFS